MHILDPTAQDDITGDVYPSRNSRQEMFNVSNGEIRIFSQSVEGGMRDWRNAAERLRSTLTISGELVALSALY